MCQACHGDASAHVKDPVKVKPANRLEERDGRREDRRLHDLPRQATASCVLGVRQARDATTSPARAATTIHGKVRRTRGRAVPTTFRENEADMCGTCHQQIRAATLEAFASPDPGRQGQVQRLPQSARRADAGDAEARDGQPAVLVLPRRQARPVRVRASGGRGELRLLPQPARLVARLSAEREGAEPLPGLSRLVAAPGHVLRRPGSDVHDPRGNDGDPVGRSTRRSARA